ncbi:MAG: hypothetical protein K1X81_01735 [Bacteroidia bacterium]|nr:hypothetical protein [Bacteroidia bacterium]
MKSKNLIPKEIVNKSELVDQLSEAFFRFKGKKLKITGYVNSSDYKELKIEIFRLTGTDLSLSFLRDLITLTHKKDFQHDSYNALKKFVEYYLKQQTQVKEKEGGLPLKQMVFWGVNQNYRAGVFIDSFDGAFIDWTNLESELNEIVIAGCPRLIPIGSRVQLFDFYGKKDWLVNIIDKDNNNIGSVWLGGDPHNGWQIDGLVRVGKTISDTEWDVWQIFQRYSDGSYRTIKSFV